MAQIPIVEANPSDVAGPMSNARQARQEDVDLGPGIEAAGHGLTTAANDIERRNTQEDLMNAHLGISQVTMAKTAAYKQQLENYEQVKTDAGVIDPVADRQKRQDMEDAFRQDLQDSISKLGDGMQTSYGSKYFSQHGDNAFKQVMGSFHTDMSKMAADNTVNAIKENHQLTTLAINNEPRLLVQKNADEGAFIMQYGKLADIPQAKLRSLIDTNAKENAFAAIYGIARKPDTADGVPGTTIAKEMLKNGYADNYLNDKDKEAAFTHIEQIQKANDYDNRQKKDSDKEAQRIASLKAIDGFMRSAVDDKHTPGLGRAIMDADPLVVQPHQKQWLLNMLKDKNEKPNSALQAHYFQEMQRTSDDPKYDPHLMDKVNKSVGPGGLSLAQRNQLSDMYQNKGGHATNSNDEAMWKATTDNAKNLIGKPDALGQIKDPNALDKWNSAAIKMDQYKAQMRQELGPQYMSQITDPKNKHWVGNVIGLHHMTMSEYLESSRTYMQKFMQSPTKPAAPAQGNAPTTTAPKTRMFKGVMWTQGADGQYRPGGK